MNSNTLRRLPLALSLAFGSCLLWNACNGDSGTNPPAGNTHQGLIDACSLLTKAEVEAVFGKPVLTMTSDTSSYITSCSYVGSVEPGQALGTHLMITAFTTSSMQSVLGPTQSVPLYFSNLRTILTNWETQPGVGTDAIWEKLPGKLAFYKGDVSVSLLYSYLGKVVDTTTQARNACVTAGVKAAAKI